MHERPAWLPPPWEIWKYATVAFCICGYVLILVTFVLALVASF